MVGKWPAKACMGEYSVNTVLAGRCGEICKGTTKA